MNAERVASRLPCRSHSDNPAVSFPVDDSLSDMCDQGETEEDGIEIGGGGAGTEVPVGIDIIFGRAMDRHDWLDEGIEGEDSRVVSLEKGGTSESVSFDV